MKKRLKWWVKLANQRKKIYSVPSNEVNFQNGVYVSRLCQKWRLIKHLTTHLILTKVWPHKDYPLIEVGVVELNRNPENYFAEVEQIAFSPSNVIPGVGFSPDKMLQARIFSYADAHRYRLGTHYEALPINAPKCPVHHYHKDGAMHFMANSANPDAYYQPNSFNGPLERPDVQEPPLRIQGDAARYDHRDGNEDFSQPRALFNLFDDQQKNNDYLIISQLLCRAF